MTPVPTQPSVAIVGGGLAGLAAACALSDSGLRVTLFEKRPFLGGRASSYEHPGTGEVIDNCQHVLFRSCTNLIDFYERIGVGRDIRWYEDMTFVEPGGRSTVMRASALPAPMHTAPSFLSFPFLTTADKLAIARAMIPLTLTVLRDDGRSFRQWLNQHGQTTGAIDHFWKPVLISALSEDLDRVSISSAAQVVRVSMKSPAARHMGVPTAPLTDLYNAAGEYIRARGGELRFRSSVTGFRSKEEGVHIQSSSGDELFDYVVLALPFGALDQVLPPAPESSSLREMLTHFETSPITGVHLWFDRQISELDHAVLLDRTIQWMFHKSRIQRRFAVSNIAIGIDHGAESSNGGRGLVTTEESGSQASSGISVLEPATESASGSYIELVISASKSLIEKSRGEIVELAVREVREFFPAAREANLIKSAVVKEVHATYSPRPGIDAFRPGAQTAWARVFLAGDWTATGWPATMESAVRSGYIAAEKIALACGRVDSTFLVPDLPASGLMRLFG